LFSLPCRPTGLDLDIAFLAIEVVTEAAPGPVLRLCAKAAGDWVAVDVAKLLDPLARAEDIEVIIARLPEGSAIAAAECSGDRLLRRL